MSTSQQSCPSLLPEDVEAIKSEGNALFTQGLFLEAIAKYSIAIQKVPDNAILFANRAACYNSLKK
jgi:tetratricopeptide (TPR) repeat protein